MLVGSVFVEEGAGPAGLCTPAICQLQPNKSKELMLY